MADTERRKLLDAYYGGAIDVPTLKAEQARIGADLTAAKERLAYLDANHSEWQELPELAATLATRCATPIARPMTEPAGYSMRPCSPVSTCKDGPLCHEEYRAPFGDIFGLPEFDTEHESGRRESNPRSQLGKLMFCR